MIDQNNWYKSFFSGMAIEMWHSAVPAEFTEKEIAFILEISRPGKGSAILDIPCGSGRHSIPLARKGYRVTALDISPENIRLMEDSVRKEDLELQAIESDLFEYSAEKEFDLAICLGNSFSYFPIEQMLNFSARIHKGLKPGAKFIINTGALAESIIPNLKQKDWYEIGDLFFVFSNVYLPEAGVLKSDMIFIKKDQQERKTAYHYVFTCAEIIGMLRQAGFHDVTLYGGVDGAPYRFADHQAYIVAGK